MATSIFKWNAIAGLALKVIGNKFTERVVMEIFAFQDTDSQTWAVVANPILEATHVSIDDVSSGKCMYSRRQITALTFACCTYLAPSTISCVSIHIAHYKLPAIHIMRHTKSFLYV